VESANVGRKSSGGAIVARSSSYWPRSSRRPRYPSDP
jgi:hypothetical protein